MLHSEECSLKMFCPENWPESSIVRPFEDHSQKKRPRWSRDHSPPQNHRRHQDRDYRSERQQERDDYRWDRYDTRRDHVDRHVGSRERYDQHQDSEWRTVTRNHRHRRD